MIATRRLTAGDLAPFEQPGPHLYLRHGRRFVFEDDPLSFLRPDVAFVRAERIYPGLEERGFMAIIPDLVVEVLSPGVRSPDIARTIEQYRRANVP